MGFNNRLRRVQFQTHGRENATNEYRDCGCIIFLGLHYKPRYAIKALIYGEKKGVESIGSWVKASVEEGELITQLQQGSGRGAIREDKEEVVYFCSWDAPQKLKKLEKVFPSADIGLFQSEEVALDS